MDDQSSNEHGTSGRDDALLERADALLAQAAAVREHYRELSERLDRIGQAAPVPAPGEGVEGQGEDTVRLVAANLFLNGLSRSEVAAYLEETFGATDTDELLDELQGGEGDRPQRRRFSWRR